MFRKSSGFSLCPQDYLDGEVMLVNENKWSNKLRKAVVRRKVQHLRFSRSAGWTDTDFSFLSDLKEQNILGVDIYLWDSIKLESLAYLKTLKRLSLECRYTTLPDLATFRDLEVLQLNYRANAKTFVNCKNLRVLNIQDYPYEDLSQLSLLTNLVDLSLTSKKLKSLNGIENLVSLRKLDVFRTKALSDISALKSKPEIEVSFEACPNVT